MATKVVLKNKQTLLKTVKTQLNKKWSSHLDIESASSGVSNGADGMRAMRRLRESGINVVKRYNKNNGVYEYRIKH